MRSETLLKTKTPLLGGVSPAAFMRHDWQQRAKMIRQAIPNFTGVVTPNDVLRLATRDDVPSRLILREGVAWHVEHGPFSAKALKQLPAKNWTILIQDLNTIVPAADALMRRFSFVPYTRLDDVMVSLAAPGGGVGAHFDSYDVFLLQGTGRRRWKISQQADLSLRPNLPLKILKRFVPTAQWDLSPGDMLYLPPKFSHEGVALDTCLTFSIGFRAPTAQEALVAVLEHALDREDAQSTAQPLDLTRTATSTPARLPAAYVRRFADAVRSLRQDTGSLSSVAGTFASTPKPHVVFDSPLAPITAAQRKALRQRSGAVLALDPRTIMLYDAEFLFINGEQFATPSVGLRMLADLRATALQADTFSTRDATLIADWIEAGWIYFIKNN